MDQKIMECRSGKISDSHILPFFWQHGEEHHLLAEEMDAIQACGIQEICVESRPHPQFCQDKWWDDFGFILKEARRRNMRVWLLDDQKFPTGYAAGYIYDHPELRMTSLRIIYTDFIGPQKETALIAAALKPDEQYVGIIAYHREKKGIVLKGEGVDLMPLCQDGLIWWDIPEGAWRVYYIIRTHDVFAPYKEAYIDMLSEESCAAMIHGVYQPHYEHFAEYFGNTFVGFFSDEPSFSNDARTYWSILGKEGMLIPWHDDLLKEMAEYTDLSQQQIYLLLPGLLHDIAGKTKLIREAYMEVATKRYSRNFSWQLGNWCRAHGVSYIGHIIEDMNTHQRLGFGPGHFFRSMEGQDMAGIDIVLNQIIPGFTDFDHTNNACERTIDCDFYQYTLAKLGASQAHLEPLKKNRAMCEIYGAFGWAEGVPMMKYLTDQMLVSGINYFVPHAFTPMYPDPDCPPHFYARGKNHQFPVFIELMGYMKRMCHILSEGTHQASVAVYYNAEGEWAAGKCMVQQEVCRELTRKQMDFDLVPQDILCRDSEVKDDRLYIHEESYRALVVPYSQYLPVKLLKELERLVQKGLQVIFVNGLPDGDVAGNELSQTLARCEVIDLEKLAETLANRGLQGVLPHEETPHLRFYHLHKGERDIVMVWNESIFEEIDTWVELPVAGQAAFYDGWTNEYYAPEQSEQAVRLRLAPMAALIIDIGERDEAITAYDYRDQSLAALDLEWTVSLKDGLEEEYKVLEDAGLGNLARNNPEFAGRIRYEATWQVTDPSRISVIDLGTVGETAQLWINDAYCGSTVSSPHRYYIGDKLVTGENKVRILVCNNLGYRHRECFSELLPLPPSGLLGPVQIG